MKLETRLTVIGLRAMALSMTYALIAAWALRKGAEAATAGIFTAE